MLAFGVVGVEWIDILPAGLPARCAVRHGWLAKVTATTDEEQASYDALFRAVHAAVRDEDFAMLPQFRAAIR